MELYLIMKVRSAKQMKSGLRGLKIKVDYLHLQQVVWRNQYIHILEIDIPVIVYNGARVYCTITNKALYKKQLYVSQSMWNELLNNDLEVGIFIYKDSKPFVLKRNSIVDEFEKKEKVNCEQG